MQKVLRIARSKGAITAADLECEDLPRQYLQRLYKKGMLDRVGRGVYALPGGEITEHHTLVEASSRVPKGVACLLTALRVHDLTTQNPYEVWMAVERKSWVPQPDSIPIRFVYMSGPAFSEGVEDREIEGVQVRVFGPAKTVADCFKYRNKIGVDVAVEALSDYRKSRYYDADALWAFAKICKVADVIRPYLEAIG